MEWSEVANDMECDGALRDLYVLRTTLADWERFVSALDRWPYSASYSIDGRPARIPAAASEAFDERTRASPLLRIDLGGVLVCCPFFDPDRMEFNVDPAEVQGPGRLALLSSFVERLRHLFCKQVVVTPENMPARPFAVFSPATGDFTYHPAKPSPGAL